MKIYGFLLVALLATSFTAFGQNKKVSKRLMGTWQVESVDLSQLLEGIAEEEKAMAALFMPMMEDGLKTLVWQFKSKGEFESSMEFFDEKIEEKKTWSVSADGKNIIMVSGEERAEYIIQSLSKTKMVVSVKTDDGTTIKMTMVKKKK